MTTHPQATGPSGSRIPYRALLGSAREQAARAATRLSAGKKPVGSVSQLGLGLTALGHRTADKVLRQQQKMLEHQIDALAARLRTAATASGFGNLLGAQLRLAREDAAQFAQDAREALTIVAGAGRDVGTLLRGTVTELRGRPGGGTGERKTQRKAAARKSGRPQAAARRAARKPSQSAG